MIKCSSLRCLRNYLYIQSYKWCITFSLSLCIILIFLRKVKLGAVCEKTLIWTYRKIVHSDDISFQVVHGVHSKISRPVFRAKYFIIYLYVIKLIFLLRLNLWTPLWGTIKILLSKIVAIPKKYCSCRFREIIVLPVKILS